MPTRLFSSKQRAALDAFPEAISDEDFDRFFALSDLDRNFVRRFGDGAVDVAVMLGTLRMLGFVPGTLDVPEVLVDFVRTTVGSGSSDDPGQADLAPRSRRDWVIAVTAHAGWRRPAASELKLLDDWLLERAMEHDRPEMLFGLTLDCATTRH